MTPQPDHELVQLLRTIRYELTALQAKVSDGLTMAARLPAPSRESDVWCPMCTLSLVGQKALAEHVFHVHDGPEPEHWRELEREDEALDERERAVGLQPQRQLEPSPERVKRWTRWPHEGER